MNEVQIFNSEEFGSVRVAEIDGEPWFVGKDVAACLGYVNTKDALAKHVDPDDKIMGSQNATPSITDKLGRKQYPTFINESGFYSLVLSSKLSSAQKFKHWVTYDVLPSIRKHGAYMTTDTMAKAISDPDFAIGLLQALKEEQEKSKDLEARIEREKPMVELGKGITKAVNDITIGEMAKILKQNGVDTGRTRFFQTLRDDGYLMTQNGEKNIPTQKAMNLGVFHVTMKTITLPHTNITRTTHQTMVTGKGQAYFFEKYTA